MVKEDENHVYGVAILGGVGDLNGKSIREAAKHPLVSETWKYNVQPARLQDSTYKRHVLADSGINLIHQRTIAVERFAVLDFHRSLPNARLQSGGLDIVLYIFVLRHLHLA